MFYAVLYVKFIPYIFQNLRNAYIIMHITLLKHLKPF